MLRQQSTTHHHMLTVGRVQHRRSDRAMRPTFLLFLEEFDPSRFMRDAGYRHQIDRSLQKLSETEATIFCRIYLKLLAN